MAGVCRRQQGQYYKELVRQVKFIIPALMTGNPTLRKLRDAAAMLNAPLLLVLDIFSWTTPAKDIKALIIWWDITAPARRFWSIRGRG